MNTKFVKTIAIVFAAAAAVEPLAAEAGQRQGTLSVTIQPGVSWETGYPPQIAVWVEKSDGTYVTTLYATARAVKKNWIFAPKNGRPESLPVWYHTSGQYAESPNTQIPAQENLDTISSATQKGTAPITKSVVVPAGNTYTLKIEVNHSFDYNEFWPKKAKKNSPSFSGVNGQPSVIYTATICADATLSSDTPSSGVLFCPAGTGSVNGSDGNIHDQLNTLTTGLTIIESATAHWNVQK
jgi:hypothetical protein